MTVPESTPTPGDTELGEKLDEIAAAIGHLLPSETFENVAIAKALGIGPDKVTRMRSGQIHCRPHHWARFIVHYQLEGKLDPATIGLPLEQFRAALRREGIGVHGASPVVEARQALFDLSLRGRSCGISIMRAEINRRAGGLGLPNPNSHRTVQLREGDLVALSVVAPEPSGHLIILDEQLGIETTCLMPSLFAPRTELHERTTRLPTITDGDLRYFTVSSPEGRHRIFAIWSRDKLPLTWLTGPADTIEPMTLTDKNLIEFAELVREHPNRSPDSVAVGTLDYRIV
ncbi:MAG: hypothetical protein NW205_10395 [Hyphomicrobiaceae bacterium]|nr:hypothetical protein [Hyphomicrobiaceae bacterium]